MKKRLSIIPAMLLFMMLAACGSIRLGGEKYPVDAADISVAAAPEDFALLDSFENLESVDFSGSTCLDEILFWSESHPDVTVRYTVPLPTGEAVPMDANSLDLSRLRHADVQEALACLKYLPGIREINLGRESEDGVTREDYLAFREACPDVRLEYSFSILGTHVSADAEKLNLSQKTVEAHMSAAIKQLKEGLKDYI